MSCLVLSCLVLSFLFLFSCSVDNTESDKNQVDVQVFNREPCDLETAFAVTEKCNLDPASTTGECCCIFCLEYNDINGNTQNPVGDLQIRAIDASGSASQTWSNYDINGSNVICISSEILEVMAQSTDFIIEWRNPAYMGPSTPGELPIYCVTINVSDIPGCF